MVSYTVIIETGKRNCSAYCPIFRGNCYRAHPGRDL